MKVNVVFINNRDEKELHVRGETWPYVFFSLCRKVK